MNKAEKKDWIAKYGVKRQVEQDWLENIRERIFCMKSEYYNSKTARLQMVRIIMKILYGIEVSLVEQIEIEKKIVFHGS